eukprot:gene791-15136_t
MRLLALRDEEVAQFRATHSKRAVLSVLNLGAALPWWQHVLRIGVAEVCTDVAHYLLSEPTYSSKYTASSKWLENKLKHHIYLPLLIIDVILHEHPVTVFGKLDPSIHNLLSKHVAEGAAGDPASKYITHSAIPMTVPELRSIRAAITKGLQSLLPESTYTIEHVPEMDDLYTTYPHLIPEGSNAEVLLPHCDGHLPNWFGGCKSYRVLVLIHKDSADHSGTFICAENTLFTLMEMGDFLAFDYNCALHKLIQSQSGPATGSRRILKLHCIAYPKTGISSWIAPLLFPAYRQALVHSNRFMRKKGWGKAPNKQFGVIKGRFMSSTTFCRPLSLPAINVFPENAACTDESNPLLLLREEGRK